jgi:DNA-binding NarL/FixJ family response regulator
MSASALIGITVSRQEPLVLRLMRQVDKLPLSKRQAEICLLLATGLSHRGIAERLNISQHTVVAHSRSIYASLSVGNRTELVNRLLAA